MAGGNGKNPGGDGGGEEWMREVERERGELERRGKGERTAEIREREGVSEMRCEFG